MIGMMSGSKPHIRNQHMTSMLVLGRFAAPFVRAKGELRVEEVDFKYLERARRHRAPSKCACVPDWITFDSAGAEQIWGDTESAAGLTLKKLDDGHPLSVTDHATLRDLAALHWIRCWYVKQASEASWEESKDETHAQICAWAEGRGRLQFDAAVAKHYGIHVAGPAGRRYYLDRLRSDAEALLPAHSAVFREDTERLFRCARAAVSQLEPVVLTPEEPDDTFVTSDAGVFTISRTGARPSLRIGDPIADADATIMPLGAKYLLVLSAKPWPVTRASRTWVSRFNLWTALHARRRVYGLPGGNWVRQIPQWAKARKIRRVPEPDDPLEAVTRLRPGPERTDPGRRGLG